MSTNPVPLEYRVRALERTQIFANARIEEIAFDLEEPARKVEELKQDRVEAKLATKEDLAATENRILDALKQLHAASNPQQPPR